MLNVLARARLSRVLDPLGVRLARAGVSPDAVTAVGTAGVVLAAVTLLARGQLLAGTLLVWLFVMSDMLDGAIARARGETSTWGAFLDSTLDRIGDAAVFGSLAWWFAFGGQSRWLAFASLACLVLAYLVSYAKARAESLGLSCDVGIAERSERLIVVLVGTGLAGMGVPYVLPVALWLLVAGALVTVGQRLLAVRRQADAAHRAVRQ